MISNYRRIGDFIQLVDERNQGHQVKQLLGLSISKQFIPSVANIIGTDMENYKIIRKNQFACSTMQVRRDKKMPVALLKEVDEAIISQAYPIFQVVDEKKLLPDYLMMWFTRSEFDREACFHAVGGVRGSLEWEDFTDMQLPVPSIDKQREIVKEYNVIQDRIKLNEELIRKLEDTAQAIYRQWFVEFEFPDDLGKPYKSNGGEMVWNEELGKEIPKGWEVGTLGSISLIKAGGDKPEIFSLSRTDTLQVPIFSNSTEDEGLFGFTDKPVIYTESITISARGAIIGYTVLRTLPFVPIIRLIVVTPKDHNQLNYLYETIRRFAYEGSGSAQGQLTIPEISEYKIILPNSNSLQPYQKISQSTIQNLEIKKQENNKLVEFKNLLLSKLATVEG